MTSAQTSFLLLGALTGLVLLGRTVRGHLPEHHLSTDSRDAVKLAMGLVATMTALLLGLLVSSAKGTYDTQRTEVIQMSAKVVFLDRVLAAFGPEAAATRGLVRGATQDAIERLWSSEGKGPTEILPNSEVGEAIFGAIQRLAPQNDLQRALKAQAASLAVELGQLRMLLTAQMVPSIPQPLLISVMVWLAVIFAGFSLLAPPNATTTIALLAAGASVAAAVFLIMELDQPLSGAIHLSSQPMRNALRLIQP